MYLNLSRSSKISRRDKKKSRRGCYRPPGSFGGFKNVLGVPQGPTVGPWKRRGRRDENRRSGYVVLQMSRRSSGWSRGIQGVQGSLYCTADTTVWVVQHYIRFLLRHSVLFYDLFSPANRRGEPIEIKTKRNELTAPSRAMH